MSRLLAAALGAVPMGQRSVTPLALRATRALQDLSNEQVRDPKKKNLSGAAQKKGKEHI